jgi:5-methylcytosine-specific restriction endonuclease McrA
LAGGVAHRDGSVTHFDTPFTGPFVKVYYDEIPLDVWYNDRKLAQIIWDLAAAKSSATARRRQRLGLQAWRAILERFGYRCAYCGVGGALQQDHRMPVKLGGWTAADNIVPACSPCNLRKRADHPDLWPLRAGV